MLPGRYIAHPIGDSENARPNCTAGGGPFQVPIISRDRHHRASAQVYDLAEIQQSRPGRMFVFAFIWGERKGARYVRR